MRFRAQGILQTPAAFSIAMCKYPETVIAGGSALSNVMMAVKPVSCADSRSTIGGRTMKFHLVARDHFDHEHVCQVEVVPEDVSGLQSIQELAMYRLVAVLGQTARRSATPAASMSAPHLTQDWEQRDDLVA